MAKAPWVRTGGAIGDTSMDEQTAFNSTGAGVSEDLKEAADSGSDPNDGIGLPQQKGAE